jgi:predicted negative regulator of RcsB-dependent stress response
MNTVVKTKPETKNITSENSISEETAKIKKFSLKHSIIVSVLIILIFAYISFDYFYVKQKIENKIVLIDNKYDSLNTYVNNKIPSINTKLEKQATQVKELQEVVGIN